MTPRVSIQGIRSGHFPWEGRGSIYSQTSCPRTMAKVDAFTFSARWAGIASRQLSPTVKAKAKILLSVERPLWAW